LNKAIIGIIGLSVIGFLMHIIFSGATKNEIRYLTDELKESIEKIEQQNNPELISKTKLKKGKVKEWAFIKILTRLLLYPFCLLLLWFSLTGFLQEGKILCGIVGIVFAVAYLISDILLVIGKNKNYSKKSV
jgi:hypothetical protein